MILSFANVLKKRKINYQKNLLVEATDVSEICAYMTYIQLALYGIPAIVNCGNTLTQEMRFKLKTPLYFLQYWKFRKFYMKENIKPSETEQNKLIKEESYKETNINGNCQISLL